jgi:hypothetical protein
VRGSVGDDEAIDDAARMVGQPVVTGGEPAGGLDVLVATPSPMVDIVYLWID